MTSSLLTPRPSRILLIGPSGQVGWELQRTLAPLGEVVAAGRSTEPVAIDLANPDSIRACIREVRPDLIVNAAAYTAVDKAEEEHEIAMAVNGDAPGIMAEEAKRISAALVHYSTDYVFDGTKGSPYMESDEPNPLSAYGRTKLAGEQAVASAGIPHLIFRTSWVYGARGNNFLQTILRLAREREQLRVVDDQYGSPTWSRIIAETTTCVLAKTGPLAGAISDYSGVYHLTAGGVTSWYGFTKAIVRIIRERQGAAGQGLKVREVLPISTEEYPLPAIRPVYSVLSCNKLQKTFRLHMPSWSQTLDLCHSINN